MEMSFWLDNNFFTVEHMHGAVNAIKRSKYSFLRAFTNKTLGIY